MSDEERRRQERRQDDEARRKHEDEGLEIRRKRGRAIAARRGQEAGGQRPPRRLYLVGASGQTKSGVATIIDPAFLFSPPVMDESPKTVNRLTMLHNNANSTLNTAPRWVSPRQAAEMLGVSRAQISRLANKYNWRRLAITTSPKARNAGVRYPNDMQSAGNGHDRIVESMWMYCRVACRSGGMSAAVASTSVRACNTCRLDARPSSTTSLGGADAALNRDSR
jgi:hypothetical protein